MVSGDLRWVDVADAAGGASGTHKRSRPVAFLQATLAH
jgi:hypothetical protein